MTKEGYVYIMASITLRMYIGVTSNLIGRIWEHKNSINKGFTEKYQCKKLVYYESWKNIEEAIYREKQLKNWHRDWKLELIRKENPTFKDLFNELV